MIFTIKITQEPILVSKSLSVDKDRATLPTLIAALFYDLSTDKEIKIPKDGEKRERELRDLIRKGKKPVALFVDEAHDLHYSTLTGLKRLIEVVEDGGGTLSVVLAGHPKLKNDLRRPTMEEIGYRATVFSLEGIVGSQREYIEWLVSKCIVEDTQISDILSAEAIELLAIRLRTPLQIEQHLTLAFEAAYLFGEKPVTTAIIEYWRYGNDSANSFQRIGKAHTLCNRYCGISFLALRLIVVDIIKLSRSNNLL